MGLTEPLLHSQVLSYLKILSQKGVSVHILSYEKKQFLTKANIYSIKQELDAAGIKWSFLKPLLISMVEVPEHLKAKDE